MIGLGMDLCAIRRVERAQETTGRFLEKYYTDEERAYIRARGRMGAQSAAAFFAAKEAFLKALGTGIGQGVQLSEIGVYHDELGAPHYRLTGKAAETFEARGATRAFLSLTHEAGVAAAVCVLE